MQVYADNAATTRMSDKALAAMTPYFQDIYGNPSSLHTVGQRAAEALGGPLFPASSGCAAPRGARRRWR